MGTAAFRTWKRENGFDNARAARTLGVPMARVADWSSGRELAPPEVAAACYAYSCGWRPSLDTAPAPRRKRRSAALEQIRVALGLPEDASTESITQAAAKASEPSLKDRTEALAAWILGGRPVPGNGGHDVRVDGPDGRHVLVEAKGRTVSAANGSWYFSQIFGENRSKRYDFILLVGERHPEAVCKDDGAGSRYALFLLSYADAERLTGRRKFQRPCQDGKASKDHGTLRIKAYGTIGGHSVAPWRDHHVSADEARHIVHAAFGG